MSTKDVFMLNNGSEGSSKGSSAKIPSSPVTFGAALETLKSLSRKEDVTLTGRNEQPFPSSWSEIIQTQRTHFSSCSKGPMTSISSDKSHFHLGRQTTMPSTTSSAATANSSDKTFSAIYSFGTKLILPHPRLKVTKPEPLQSRTFESENTSTGFGRANVNLQAEGPLYGHPKLEDGQQPNMDILNLTDPTVVVANDPLLISDLLWLSVCLSK